MKWTTLVLSLLLLGLPSRLDADELAPAEFLQPPEIIISHTELRDFIGPGMIVLAKDNILMAAPWGRPPANFRQLKESFPVPMLYRSTDGGRTWHEAGRMQLEYSLAGGISDGGMGFLRLKDGRIAATFNRHVPGLHGGGMPAISFSSDDGATWSPAKMVMENDDAYYIMDDRLIQLRSGRLVLPVAHKLGKFEGDHEESLAMLSDDAGATWRLSRGTARLDSPRGYDEPSVVELKDGRILMLARTGAGSLYASHSADGGETWSEPQATTLTSPCSSLSMYRMPDDRLIVFYNHATPYKLGAFFPRRPLCYAVSTDEGQTWGGPVLIDDTPGQQHIYPSAVFLMDRIIVVYSSHFSYDEDRFGSPPGSWKIGGGKRAVVRRPADP